MTIEKLMKVVGYSINEFFKMFDNCVININSEVGISLTELAIGAFVALFIIHIVCAFVFRN